MKILFDQNVARALRKFTPEYLTRTADEMDWAELVNGDLLKATEENGFDVFVTADKNIRYQQNLKARKISIIELSTNDWNTLKLFPHFYISAVSDAREASGRTIEYPRTQRQPPSRR